MRVPQDFGWETFWTCDGTQYINGAGARAGFNQIRAAMRRIDSTIRVCGCSSSALDPLF
jgi:hypothetical protein